MKTDVINDAIGVIRQLQSELAHVLLGQIDPSLPFCVAREQVKQNEAMKAGDKFVDEVIAANWSAA